MATYEEAFEVMMETAREYQRQIDHANRKKAMYKEGSGYVQSLYDMANDTMHRLFGQAELCRELFGVRVLRTLVDIERGIENENV